MPYAFYHEYYFLFSRGCGFAGVSVGFGAGCDGVSVGFGAGCDGVTGGTEPEGVGVIGREGVSHDLFILCPPTFLLDCWVDLFFLAICVTSFDHGLESDVHGRLKIAP